MKKIIIVLLAFWFAFGKSANAKCNKADVKGTWNVYFGLATVVACCTIKAPQISNSYCYVPGVPSFIPLIGSLNTNSDCHVTGTLTISTSAVAVDGWISRDKETISGMS